MALTKVTGSVIKDSVSLSGNVSVGGTLTYQDVTNVDALGIGTFRTGIKVLAGQVDVGSNIKLGNAGVITATSFSGVMSGTTGSFSGQVNIGSNIKLGTAGVITATSYRGDGSQLTGITGTTINNNANNRVITGSGSANTLEGESSFTYDGNGMAYITGTGAAGITIQSPDTTDTGVYFSDGANAGAVTYLHSNNTMSFRVNGQNRVQILHNGIVNMPTDNANLQIGAGQDLKLYHDGSNSYIDNATNILWIRNQTTGSSIYMRSDELLLQSYTDSPNENYIVCTRGADVKLYHNHSEKFKTTSTGAEILEGNGLDILGGTGSRSNDAVLFVNKTNNNDWAAKFDISAGSATDYGLQIKAPTAADNCFNIRDTSSNNVVRMQGNGHIHTGHHWPTSTNGSHNLGANSNKWGRVFSSNTPAVLISVNLATDSNHSAYGVQTVYHYGSGVFQVVFAANMPNANYVTTASAVGSVNGDGMVVAGIGGQTQYRTVGDLRMRVSYCTNNAGNDVTNVNLAFFANN